VKRIFSKKQVVRRYANNPIITPEMLPFNCRGVFNGSVVKHAGR
jgi:hypothetical protein